MTKTYREVFQFINAGSRWLAEHKKDEDTRLGYAIAKLIKKLGKHDSDYREAVEDLNVEHCEVNDKGHIIHENDNYVFSKEGKKKRDAAQRKLLDTPVNFEPHYVTTIPEGITPDMQVALEGFVFQEPSEV